MEAGTGSPLARLARRLGIIILDVREQRCFGWRRQPHATVVDLARNISRLSLRAIAVAAAEFHTIRCLVHSWITRLRMKLTCQGFLVRGTRIDQHDRMVAAKSLVDERIEGQHVCEGVLEVEAPIAAAGHG